MRKQVPPIHPELLNCFDGGKTRGDRPFLWHGVEQQIGENPVEANDENSGQNHPGSCQDGRCRKVLEKILHGVLQNQLRPGLTEIKPGGAIA